MMHLVLLGDSVFDNAAYVDGGPAVVDQARAALGRDGRATLCAVDGHTTRLVPGQLAKVPRDATHLVVSAGGNDALGQIDVLMQRVETVAQALLLIGTVAEGFARDHRAMLDGVAATGLPTLVCTVYEPRFEDATVQGAAVAALAHFNDAIVRNAAAVGVPVLDLRRVCTEAAHFANEIEPSSAGGERIVAALLAALGAHDFAARRAAVYPAP